MESRIWGATSVGKAPRSGKLAAAATSSLSTSVISSSRNSENSPLVTSILHELNTLIKQSHVSRWDVCVREIAASYYPLERETRWGTDVGEHKQNA